MADLSEIRSEGTGGGATETELDAAGGKASPAVASASASVSGGWIQKHRQPGGLYEKAKLPIRVLNGSILFGVALLFALLLFFANHLTGFNIHFDSLGGTDVAAQRLNYADKIAEPAAPSRESYRFGGWYLDKDFSRAWDFAQWTVEGDLTLYARWLPED